MNDPGFDSYACHFFSFTFTVCSSLIFFSNYTTIFPFHHAQGVPCPPLIVGGTVKTLVG